MDEIVNLTPHPVVIVLPDGTTITIPPSGTVARCAERTEPVTAWSVTVDGHKVPLVVKTYGEIENLPPPQDGVWYVTSALTAQAAWAMGRFDVLVPADLVRDPDGRVVGAAALAGSPMLL